MPDTSQNYGVVAHAAHDVRVDELPTPTPQPHEAIIEIAYGGICGSDLGYWTKGAAGQSILKSPMLLGHEVSGTVVSAAQDGSGPAVGTPVTVHPATWNGTWPDGHNNLASDGTYLGSAARHPHTDGAFARFVALPTHMLRPLPQGLDLKTAALAEPAAVAWHAVNRAGDLTGKSVLVIGSGPIGSLIVAVARRAGAAHITATDVHSTALNTAQAVGADATLLASDNEAIAAVAADVVFESSGNQFGLAAAIAGAKPAGTVVLVGLLPPGDQPAPVALATVKELTLVGSFRFVHEIDDVITALADGSLPIAPVITHVVHARDAVSGLEQALDASQSCKVLLDFTH